MTDQTPDRPQPGEIWQHRKTGKRYRIGGLAFNAVTDQLDVLYAPLYPCAFKVFSRQLEHHPKAFLGPADDGEPRFVRMPCDPLNSS